MNKRAIIDTNIIKADWKQELKATKYEYIRLKTPGFFEMSGGYDMKLTSWNDTTANGLTKCIIDWINFNGHYANRINCQGQARKERVKLAFGSYRDNVRFSACTTNKGTADIHAIVGGRHLSIEIKIGNDKQSKLQGKEMIRVTNAGGLYFIARNMQSFVLWYKKTFGILNG